MSEKYCKSNDVKRKYEEEFIKNEILREKQDNANNCEKGEENPDNNESKDDAGNQQNQVPVNTLIKELGILNAGNDFKTELHYISIIGSVEGHMTMPQDTKTTKYEHIIPQLIAVEENPEIKGLLIVLNTVGGDVEAGLALAEMISTLSKPTVSLVLGGGHSIGIPLAVAAKYTFIAKTATMTLHPIRTSGQVITAKPTFHYLMKTQDRIVDFIVEHSEANKDKVLELVNRTDDIANDVGTVLFGQEAVDIGIINQVGGLRDALEKLREMIRASSNS